MAFSDLELVTVEVVDAAHSLGLLQVGTHRAGLQLADRRHLEEGDHHEEEHDGGLPDAEDVRGLDVVHEAPQLRVELVCGDQVEGLGLPEVLAVGKREGGLAPAEVDTDGGLHDLDGADVVPVQGRPVAGGEAVETVEAGEEEPHPGDGLCEQPRDEEEAVSLAVSVLAGGDGGHAVLVLTHQGDAQLLHLPPVLSSTNLAWPHLQYT